MADLSANFAKGLNSYVSIDEAEDYFYLHTSSSEWAGVPSADKDKHLATAARTLELMPWIGRTATADQPMAWPGRVYSVFDPVSGHTVSGDGTQTEAPSGVKRAQMELALHYARNPDVLTNSPRIAKAQLDDLRAEGLHAATALPSFVMEPIRLYLDSGGYGLPWYRYN